MPVRQYGVINVVVHPHPEGAYRSLFKHLSQRPCRFFGPQYAAVSPIGNSRGGIFSGQLGVWTEIDRSSNVIDKSSLTETPFDESGLDIPANVGFNSRVFNFAFVERDHKLIIELSNDLKKRITVNMAQRALSALAERYPPNIFDEVHFHIVPEAESVERILSLPVLRRIEMKIYRPNPDEFDKEAQSVLEELEAQGAKSQDVTMVKASGFATLALNGRNRILAYAAALNGFIRAAGSEADGEQVHVSTRDHPKIIERDMPQDATSVAAVRQVAREYRGAAE